MTFPIQKNSKKVKINSSVLLIFPLLDGDIFININLHIVLLSAVIDFIRVQFSPLIFRCMCVADFLPFYK